MSLEKFFQEFGIVPKQVQLYEQALTHKSFAKNHNERLEYLGDAVLDLVIGEALFVQYPTLREGELSRFRAELVNGHYLAEKARKWHFGQFIRLGSGEYKAGGANKESILADAFEAVLGALYLDVGYEITKTIILHLFVDDVQKIAQKAKQKDNKTRLQEWLQATKLDLPSYQLVETKGQDHQQIFTVRCDVPTMKLSVGATGNSKKQAEQNAAEQMLQLLEKRQLL